MTTKPTFTGNRLVRQVEQAEFEHREYGAPKIRNKAYKAIKEIIDDWELPDRSDFHSRSWKRNRKTQYKS